VLPAPVRVQAGVSPFDSARVETEAWVSGDEVRARMLSAEVVVVHGGAGMISTALRSGRRPLVMCRRRGLGEHVDDHQRQIADKLAALGLAVVVEDEISDADVEAAKAPPRLPAPFAALPSVTTVISQLLDAPAEAPAEAA
jgi:UDP-N-acetylglucosamine transferase subunit ALG13